MVGNGMVEDNMKKQKSATLFVWMRLGAACEYEKHGDVSSAAGMLHEAGVHGPLRQGECGKVFASGYESANYISLYWGTVGGSWAKNLTKAEIKAVEQELDPVPDLKAIRAGCERISKELKTKIRIQVDGIEKEVTKEDYIEAKTKDLVEFGYDNLTEETVAEQLEVILTGQGKKTVIGMFIEKEVVI